jgi:hypothetical protein
LQIEQPEAQRDPEGGKADLPAAQRRVNILVVVRDEQHDQGARSA